jgi:hypothetical protein
MGRVGLPIVNEISIYNENRMAILSVSEQRDFWLFVLSPKIIRSIGKNQALNQNNCKNSYESHTIVAISLPKAQIGWQKLEKCRTFAA